MELVGLERALGSSNLTLTPLLTNPPLNHAAKLYKSTFLEDPQEW